MIRQIGSIGVALGLVVATGLAPVPAAAQSLWMQRDGDRTIMLEMLRPSIEDLDADPFSASFFLAGRFALSPNVALVAEVPFANLQATDQTFFGFETSSSALGNPYLGLEAKVSSAPLFFEAGVRPPVASDNEEASFSGLLADVTRWDAFPPDLFAIQTAFNVREVTPSHVMYRLRLSPTIWIPSGDNNGDTEIYAVYSFQIGYHGSAARVGAGMAGRALLTEDFGNLGERSANQLEFHADFLPGSIRPALDLKLPLESLSQVVPVVIGGSISWAP